MITVIGIEAAFLIGGLIMSPKRSSTFPASPVSWSKALRWRDYPIVQNSAMLIAVVVVLANFTVDMTTL